MQDFAEVLTVRQEDKNCRRQPNLDHPQVFLDHRPREEVQRLVAAKTNGATPLVLSCRSHLTISLHLTQGQPVSLGFSPGTATMRWLSTSWTGAAPPSNRFDLHEQDIANGSIIQNMVDCPRYCRLSKMLSIIQDIVDYSRYHLRRAVSPLTGKRSRELLHCGALLQQVRSINEEQ